MEAKYGPGAVFYEISDWKNFTPNSDNSDIAIIDSNPFKSITQQVKNGDSEFVEMYWVFEKKNDSITNINLSVRSPHNEFSNRWSIINPLESSIYIDTLKQRILAFNKKLNALQKTYKIKVQEEVSISPQMNCICHSSKNIPVDSKAKEMLHTIGYLENYVLERDLKLTGPPFVKVTKWERNENLIDFDFCFPVNLAQDIKPTPIVDFREIKSFTALKAVFNGNYRLSHLAWYDLLNRAEELNLETNALPLEIFHNNPKVEIDSENWKAEVFLPVIEKSSE